MTSPVTIELIAFHMARPNVALRRNQRRSTPIAMPQIEDDPGQSLFAAAFTKGEHDSAHHNCNQAQTARAPTSVSAVSGISVPCGFFMFPESFAYNREVMQTAGSATNSYSVPTARTAGVGDSFVFEEGTWTADGNTITITIVGLANSSPYSVSDDTMTVTDDEGEEQVLTRNSSPLRSG